MKYPRIAAAWLALLFAVANGLQAAGTADFTLPPVAEPAIPAHEVNLVDFGAIPDGKTLNTAAFAKAIAAVGVQGGGRVVVPAGMWMTGPIDLVSNLELHVEAGAMVKFSPEAGLFAGRKGLIYGKRLDNVAITGPGAFEGTGQAWRPVKDWKMTEKQWKKLLDSGGWLEPGGKIWWPSEKASKTRRPRLVRLDQCTRILFEDAIFRNSPSFALDISDCENLTMRNVYVKNDWFAQNGDGIDLHSCKDVQLLACKVDVGDDALCMKSNTGKPLENVLIRDCIVYHGHGGFVTGSEEAGGMWNLRVENCLFMGTDVGIRFKSGRDRGNVVENFDIHNVYMVDIAEEAILFDMYYQEGLPLDGHEMLKPGKAEPITETTPQYRNITIRDMVCRGAERAILMTGLPEMTVKNILLENVAITAKYGVACMDAENISMKNVEILNEKGPAFQFFNAQGVNVEGLGYNPGVETFAVLSGVTNSGIKIDVADPAAANSKVKLTGGADTSALKIE